MSGQSRSCLALLALIAFAGVPADPPAARFDEWKFDVLHRKNGRRAQGLLVEETPLTVRFRYVIQRPGEPTRAFPATTFARAEIDRIERLGPEDRQVLQNRLQSLDAQLKDEAARMGSLKLRPIPWGQDGQRAGLAYGSEQFALRSGATEDTVRLVAVRLEQIYAAYARVLPPRTFDDQPTKILLIPSLAEYRELLQSRGRNLANPALYDAARDEIVCACELDSLLAQKGKVQRKHQQVLERLRQEEAELIRQYKGKVPAKFLKPIKEYRQQVEQANKENEKHFQAATQRSFQVLYHEAFHAYLANFVYPASEGEVPRWLNEGLAQIFETAIIEAGEMRVGHADLDRLTRVKAAVRKQDLIRLPELLNSGGRDFLVAHANDRAVSDRHYLAAWALAFYLTFERHKLGTPELDEYTRACKRGADPLEAFQTFVHQPLPQFEKAWHQYLLELRSDGSTDKPVERRE
jgi:hypothetical protein